MGRVEIGNGVIAHTLQWLAVLTEIDEGDAALAAAYRHAAHAVKQLDEPVAARVRMSGPVALERLGIAPKVAALIAEWVRTGALPVLSDVQKQKAGLWPALTRALCKTLGIESAERRPRTQNAKPAPAHRQVWESWN